ITLYHAVQKTLTKDQHALERSGRVSLFLILKNECFTSWLSYSIGGLQVILCAISHFIAKL
ncbi:hypothetical protein AB6C48_13450, partial [Vibrio splendidus]